MVMMVMVVRLMMKMMMTIIKVMRMMTTKMKMMNGVAPMMLMTIIACSPLRGSQVAPYQPSATSDLLICNQLAFAANAQKNLAKWTFTNLMGHHVEMCQWAALVTFCKRL